MFSKRSWILVFSPTLLGLAVVASTAAQAGPPASPLDAGPTASSELITTSIILNVTDPQGLADYIQATVTPGSGNYHRFLTVGQFRQRYAPSTQQIMQLVRYLKSYGITLDKIYADNLDITVTGTAAEFNAAFSTELRDYVKNGQRFHRPAQKLSLPGELTKLVLAVPGLANESGRFHPMLVRAAPAALVHGVGAGTGGYPAMQWPKNGTATGIPTEYTVGDVANFYQVNPLYQAGVSGRGQTVGIMTLANFNVADVEAYWADIGLKVAPNRITKVLVDGGIAVQPNVGDSETSIDVEQSGGLAPQAKIQVYIAPNTGNGFIDIFYAAASDNVADTLSISWGEAEELYFAAANGGVDFTDQMTAIDQALMEAAAQGQSVFTAAGDSGAYDVYRDIPANPDGSGNGVNGQLSVDYPASDPYITAAGGTTMKGLLQLGQFGFVFPDGSPFNVNIPQEQVWGWDYFNPYCAAYGATPAECGFEYVGGGGGVSSFWNLPYYQQSVAGITQTQPNQTLICETVFACSIFSVNGTPPQPVLTLPGGFAGRNVPDLSLNADPFTGYVIVDCTDFPEPANPGCAAIGFGGTSFVAPQLDGITALIDQASGSRVGFLNPVIYTLQSVLGYGPNAPFNDITAGDNWFYYGLPGYDNGAGIGTINAANLAHAYMFLDILGSGQR